MTSVIRVASGVINSHHRRWELSYILFIFDVIKKHERCESRTDLMKVIAKHKLNKEILINNTFKIRRFPCDSSTPQVRSLVVSLERAVAPKFLIKGVHQILRYITKNRFLRGQGAEQKIAQKHGQNVIFSFCTEEKVDKKWAKPSHLPGVSWFSKKGHFFTFFMIFVKIWHHHVRCTLLWHDSVDIEAMGLFQKSCDHDSFFVPTWGPSFFVV